MMRAFVLGKYVTLYVFRGDSKMVDYSKLLMSIYAPIQSSANKLIAIAPVSIVLYR